LRRVVPQLGDLILDQQFLALEFGDMQIVLGRMGHGVLDFLLERLAALLEFGEVAFDRSVAIIMGSQSDWATMRHAADTLDALGVAYDALGVAYDARIVSAHRTPDRLVEFAKGAKAAGFKVVIAGAGGAAHLPGMTAAMTPLPVFGVPVESKASRARTACCPSCRCRRAFPVGTLAIGKPGAVNAALLAAAVLALNDTALAPGSTPSAPPDRNGRGAPVRKMSLTASPRDTIGILGGGQLGRMTGACRARLGLRTLSIARARRPGFRCRHRDG
jgi:5-(carboxyamino)imidazole ribonucleotide mutase